MLNIDFCFHPSENQIHGNIMEQTIEVNLEDENIRVAIMKGDIDFMQKAFSAGIYYSRIMNASHCIPNVFNEKSYARNSEEFFKPF